MFRTLPRLILTSALMGLLFWPGLSRAEDIIPADTNTIPEAVVVTPPEESSETIPLRAEAGQDKAAVVGRHVLFDASRSSGPTGSTLAYSWSFGDGQDFSGIDATHVYTQPGTYKVRLTITDGKTTAKDSLIVRVAEDVVVLVADDSVSKDNIKSWKQVAERNNSLLVIIRPTLVDDTAFVVEQDLTRQLITARDDINQARIILVATKQTIGLNALSEMGRILNSPGSETSLSGFEQKAIIHLTPNKLPGTAFARLAQNTYNALQPRYLILTTESAVTVALANHDLDVLVGEIQNQNIPYQLLGKHSQRALGNLKLTNIGSYVINYLINQGADPKTLYLILILPLVATIIAFSRQVIGVKAFGITVPSIIALAFVAMQLKYGLVVFAVLLVTATLARIIARYLRLLYLPRMAIVLTVVSFSIIIMFAIAALLHRPFILSLSVFPMLMMIIVSEAFVETQIEQGNRAAVLITLETLALAMVSYVIVTWDWLETIVLAYPEIILFTIVINIILGRFSGLRLTEYFRFRRLFKKTDSTT